MRTFNNILFFELIVNFSERKIHIFISKLYPSQYKKKIKYFIIQNFEKM